MKTPERPLGLYIHIPFCKQKCAYCDFYSLAGSESRMDDYVQALCADLTETAGYTPGYTVDTIYFGGGTPTYLGEKRLVHILKTILKRYKVTKDAEITLEANPDSAGDWKALRALRRAGFNRISLGMQSGCDQELREIGRVHTAAVALGPDHLSCYGLKVEEGTPLFARRETAGLPDDEAQADFYLWTVEYLAGQGYGQYEISNFAKPGRESRHNLKYWRLQEYAGFGPGAHSDLGGLRYACDRSLDTYIQGVRDHASVFSESDRIPPADRDVEWVMLGLRTTYGLDPKDYEYRFRRRFSPFLPFLAKCAQAGYAREEEGRWRLTPQGFLRSNAIIVELLEIQASEKRRRAEAAARGDFRVDLD